MSKPICVKCGRSMKPEKNGVIAEEMQDPGMQQGYKKWSFDKWKCPICGYEVLSGCGCNPLAYAHDEDYNNHIAEVQFY